MTRSIVTGPDPHGIADALSATGGSVQVIPGTVTTARLIERSVAEADHLILTDPTEATAIPLARERNESITVIVYADDSVPDFARHIADLILDPDLLSVDAVIEEIVH